MGILAERSSNMATAKPLGTLDSLNGLKTPLSGLESTVVQICLPGQPMDLLPDFVLHAGSGPRAQELGQ